MDTLGIIFTVVIIVILVLVGLYFLGRKLQKKQVASQEMIEQNRQQVSALIIDKKKMKITDSTLPKAAVNQVPFYLKMRKMPMVKVKIGPQIATLLCDGKVFKYLPVKKMVKIEIAGAYILGYSTAKKGDRKPEPRPSSPSGRNWPPRLPAYSPAPKATRRTRIRRNKGSNLKSA